MIYSQPRRLIAVSLFLLIMSPARAFADTLQGSVLKTSAASMDLVVYDAQGRAYPNALKLKTDTKTRMAGVSAVSGLRLKDWVQADVSRQKDGSWHADSVTKLAKPPQKNVSSAGSPPSNALMDALKSPQGQNAIRGGISGAVVGGVSSYASGGKAGKGALIGAGVGAAAGLLQGLFNQPAQPQQQSAPAVTRDDSHSG